MLAVDISNYTSELTPAALAAWKAGGVELVIVQAIDPPPGFPAGRTQLQIEACLAAGLAVDAYVWLWFDAPTSDISSKLSILAGLPPVRQLWLDIQDSAAVKNSKLDPAPRTNKRAA